MDIMKIDTRYNWPRTISGSIFFLYALVLLFGLVSSTSYGANPLVTSPTSDGGEGVSQILDFSLTFDQNMDYSSLRDSVFRLRRTNASGVTFASNCSTSA